MTPTAIRASSGSSDRSSAIRLAGQRNGPDERGERLGRAPQVRGHRGRHRGVARREEGGVVDQALEQEGDVAHGV